MATEEERAAEHRRALAARERSRLQRERSLAGSASAAKAVRDAWRPWTDPQPQVVEPQDSNRVN